MDKGSSEGDLSKLSVDVSPTYFCSQVFGSTLIEDLQSNMHATDAEVQTMKQQLSAAHAAVQQQAAFSTGITSRVQSFEERSNVTAAVEPSSLDYSAASMSFVGASGPVSVALSFWSLHVVAGARDVFLATDEMPGLATPVKGDPNKSSTGVETIQICNSSVVDTAADATSSSENASAQGSGAEFSETTHPIILIPSDSDAGQVLKLANNQTPTVLPPAFIAAPSVGSNVSEQPAVTRVNDEATILLDSLLAEATTDAVTTFKSDGLPEVSGTLGADFADSATTVSEVATNLAINESVVDETMLVAAASQLASEPSSASDSMGFNASAAALEDNATAGDNAELEEIARYLDASLEALQSIMTPSSATGMVSIESTSAAASEAIAPATAIAISDSTSSVSRDTADALACDEDTRSDRPAGPSALSIELNSATASSPASSPAPLQQPATVFKQLTRKLKELEVDQSIMSVYLSDLRTSYSASIASLQQSVEGIRSAREQGATARDAKLDALAHAVFEMREALSLLYHRHVSLLRRMPAPLADGAGRDSSPLSIAGNAGDDNPENREEYEQLNDDDDGEASSELEKSDELSDEVLDSRAVGRRVGVHGKAPTARRSAAPGPTQTRSFSALQLSPSPTPALARCDAENELLELSKEFRDMIEAVSSVPGAREVDALVGAPESDARGRVVQPVAAVFLPTSSLAAILSIEQLRGERVADSVVESESSAESVPQTVHSDDALKSPLSPLLGQTVLARSKHSGASPASNAAGSAELRVLRRRLELVEERLEAAAASIVCGSVAVGGIVVGLAIGQATAVRR